MKSISMRFPRNVSKAFWVANVLVSLFAGIATVFVTPSIAATTEAEWVAAKAQADQRIKEFDAALKTKNLERIRKSGLALQADPMAVQMINQNHPNLVKANNEVTGKIKADAKELIKSNMVKEWNARAKAAGSKDRITTKDVRVYEATNYKDPTKAKPKSGQDWDVTVQVSVNQGKFRDVPPSQSQKVVERSYYDAAGGDKTFGKRPPGVKVQQAAAAAAHRQGVETTYGKSADAYNEAKTILGTKEKPPEYGKALQDPKQLTPTIEHKSNLARNNAEAAIKTGNVKGAVDAEVEAARQAAKQYENITKPRVEAAGGKVNPKVDEGMKILKDVGDMKISPAEGNARLAKLNQTRESIISKASGQAEAAQVLQPAETTMGSKARKALNAAGTTVAILDIAATAEDIRKDIREGKTREATIKTGEAIANQATLGAYGAGKGVKEKLDDRSDAQREIDNANRTNEVAYDLAARNALLKNGVSKAEVEKIMEAKAAGDESVLANKFKQLEIRGPEKIVEAKPKADDTLAERAVETAKGIGTGMIDNVGKAAKFAKGTMTDIWDMGASAYQIRQANIAAQQAQDDLRRTTIDNLIAKGATPDGAQKAAEALLKGDASMAKRLEELLDNRKAAKERATNESDKSLTGKTAKDTVDPAEKANKEEKAEKVEKAAKEENKDKAGKTEGEKAPASVQDKEKKELSRIIEAQTKVQREWKERDRALKADAAAKMAKSKELEAKAIQSRAEATKAQAEAARLKAKADKSAAEAAKAPKLPPGTHEEVSGWAKNNTGSTKLTYIKDAAGNVIGGSYTHYDTKGRQIGVENFKTPAPATSAPPVPAKSSEPDFAKIIGGVNKSVSDEYARQQRLAPQGEPCRRPGPNEPAAIPKPGCENIPSAAKPTIRRPGLDPNSD